MINSIITTDTEHCLICGNPNVVSHHALFGNGNRSLADSDNLIIPLCPKHHNIDSKESVHLNPTIGMWSKIVGQLSYEMELISTGKAQTKEEAKELFRRRYGKSYL